MAIQVKVKWLDKPFTRRLRSHLADNLYLAAHDLRDGIVSDITATQGSYRPPDHSQPGEVPFWITGEVANSFDVLVNRRQLHAMIYSDDPVSRFLEYGTSRMRPRPYFLRAFFARKRNIAYTMCRPLI